MDSAVSLVQSPLKMTAQCSNDSLRKDGGLDNWRTICLVQYRIFFHAEAQKVNDVGMAQLLQEMGFLQ